MTSSRREGWTPGWRILGCHRTPVDCYYPVPLHQANLWPWVFPQLLWKKKEEAFALNCSSLALGAWIPSWTEMNLFISFSIQQGGVKGTVSNYPHGMQGRGKGGLETLFFYVPWLFSAPGYSPLLSTNQISSRQSLGYSCFSLLLSYGWFGRRWDGCQCLFSPHLYSTSRIFWSSPSPPILITTSVQALRSLFIPLSCLPCMPPNHLTTQ